MLPIAPAIQTLTSVQDDKNWQAMRQASDETGCATDLVAKQAESEEKARSAATFKTTCVEFTECYKVADQVSSAERRPTKEQTQKK